MIMTAPDGISAQPQQIQELLENDGLPVLVVDDSATSRRLVGQLIARGTGRNVLYADSAREALALLRHHEPSVVVADVEMPGMNGLELVESIRCNWPGLPVILMASSGNEPTGMLALKAGATSFVTKPGLAKTLVRTLLQVFALSENEIRPKRILASQVERTSRFIVENDPLLLAPLVTTIQDDLTAFRIGDRNARLRVGIALQEALANAVYHGNLECSSDLRQLDERVFHGLAEQRRQLEPYRSRRIHVESTISHSRMSISIRDEGPGFDIRSLDKPFDPEDLTRVGGRGLLLIRTFMDEVFHNPTGNEIRLVKHA